MYNQPHLILRFLVCVTDQKFIMYYCIYTSITIELMEKPRMYTGGRMFLLNGVFQNQAMSFQCHVRDEVKIS